MKKISILGLAGLFTLSLQSCFFSEDDVFDQTPSERIESTMTEYQKVLTEAPNGWLLEYYAGGENHDIGGVVLLLKFEGEDVTVASDTRVMGYGTTTYTEPGEKVTSKYSLIKDQGPVLSFSSYNALIHYWSEPKGVFDADGLAGDFEFVIMSAESDKILLKGKKHGTLMTMTRLPENTDWDSYLAACNRIRTESAEYGTLVGYNNGTEFTPSAFSQSNVIRFTEQGADGTEVRNKVSFVYTEKGIKLYEPTKVNGVICDEFIWKNAEKTFVSTDDSQVKLKYVQPEDYVPIEFYTENEWAVEYTYNFARKDTSESIVFTRVGESDTLNTELSCGALKIPLQALYNHTTGMIEFRTQFLTPVTLQLITGETINAYIYLCPWNNELGTMYMTETAGIVSETKQLSPRIMTFADNGRTSGSDLNGFVFYAFEENDLSSARLGVLETYNEITLIQKTN